MSNIEPQCNKSYRGKQCVRGIDHPIGGQQMHVSADDTSWADHVSDGHPLSYTSIDGTPLSILPGVSALAASLMTDAKHGVPSAEAARAWRSDVGRLLCSLGVSERKIRSIVDAMEGAP